MSDFGYNRRRKHKPRERPTSFKDLAKDSYETERVNEPSPMSSKPPIILTKPENRTTPKQQSPVTEGIKLQSGSLSATASPSAGSNVTLSSKNTSSYSSASDGHSYNYKSSQNITSTFSTDSKEKSGMKKTTKLIDASMNWSDSALEELRERPDFVVVGVIGMQGVGKSTIMSYLSGNQPTESFKKYTFPLQTNDFKERAAHMTNGVDFFITSDNLILLDAQPILSASVLEQNIYNERKYPGEYNNPNNNMELQSLQIATFLFTVCHIVLVVQDWFNDPCIYNFLQTAEMLKLSPPSQDSLDSEYTDFYPHVVFIQNKSDESFFEPSQIVLMNDTICSLMQHSNLLYKGTFSLAKSQMFPWYNHTMLKKQEANLFLLPEYRYNRYEEKPLDNSDETFNSDKHFVDFPEYKERPSFTMMSQTLKYMILSMPRIAITRYPLTDKTWFYHASKSWDSIKKSPLMSEYNRLLA